VVRDISMSPTTAPTIGALDSLDAVATADSVTKARTELALTGTASLVGSVRGGQGVMGYVTPRRFDDQTKSRRWRDRSQDPLNPQRDIYFPAALVIAGFLGMLAWVTVAADVGPFGVVLVGMATGFATAVKTVVLVALALVASPMFGLSFGNFRTAMGKFAAAIIFSDMLLLWLAVLTDHVAGPNSGNGARGTAMFATLLVAIALVGLLVRFLFDMEWDETALVSLPLAMGSLVLGFILKVLAFVVLVLLLGASRGGAATPVAPTFALGPAVGGGAGGTSAVDGDEGEGDDGAGSVDRADPVAGLGVSP